MIPTSALRSDFGYAIQTVRFRRLCNHVGYRMNEAAKAKFFKPEERLPVKIVNVFELSYIYAAPSRYR